MKSVLFKYAEDEETGLTGWLLNDHADFQPATGFGVSHDLLEHPTLKASANNPLANELMAFGAAIWLRYETGIVFYISPYSELLGNSIRYLIQDAVFMNESPEYLIPVPNKTHTAHPIEYHDDIITAALDYIIEKLKGEFPEGYVNGEEYYGEDDDNTIGCYEFITTHKTDIISWLRRGYRYVSHRFRNFDQYNVAKMMDKIAHTSNIAVSCVEVGDLIRIILNFNEGNVKVVKVMQNDFGREVNREFLTES